MAVSTSIASEYIRFSELVYDVLKQYSGSILTKETIEGLLKPENAKNPSETLQIHPCTLLTSGSVIIGYPSYPLYASISRILYDWLKNGKSELCLDTRNPELLQECRNKEEKKTSYDFVNCKLKAFSMTCDNSTQRGILLEMFESLKLRGILDLLGMKQTAGSVEMFPPPLSTLWKSFKTKHRQNAKLSCGARELSKHCHRDSSSQWWGTVTGSESDKNEQANKVLVKILCEAVWINIHMLPHDVQVLEIRNQLGYGARWSFEPVVTLNFRGFLEPQMNDGHSVGWKH